jgi:hypothetical protein
VWTVTVRTRKATDLETLAEAIEKHATKVPEGSSPVSVARALRRLAIPLARLSVVSCNGEQSAAQVRQEVRLEARFREVCESIGCGARFTGDPRGFTARILFPDGAANTWGGASEGWGVA